MSDTGKKGPKKRADATKTQAVPAQELLRGLANPEPAGEDLARVTLPEGWEITLDVVDGADQGRSYRVTRSRVLLGRGAVEVPLSDPQVSRQHSSLEVYGSTCVLLKDLGSTNGSFVNGRRVAHAELQDGDEIRIGLTRMVVTIGTPP